MTSTVSADVPTPAHSPPAVAAGRRGNPWLSLIAVAFGPFMVGLDGSVVSIANPQAHRPYSAPRPRCRPVYYRGGTGVQGKRR